MSNDDASAPPLPPPAGIDGRGYALLIALERAGRLAAARMLLDTLRHDLSQPLTAAQANVEAALRMMSGGRADTGEIGQTLRDIAADIQRISDTVPAFLSSMTMRTPAMTHAPVDLNTAVGDVVDFMRAEADRHTILLRVHLDAGARCINGDGEQIHWLVRCLISGAFAAACASAGDLRVVSIGTTPSEEGRSMSVTISDSGESLSADQLRRLFLPFGGGTRDATGLDLSVCESIVHVHGGALRAESHPASGVTVVASFPVLLGVPGPY